MVTLLLLFGKAQDLVVLGEGAECYSGGLFGHSIAAGDDDELLLVGIVAGFDIDTDDAGELLGDGTGDVGLAGGADDAGDLAFIGDGLPFVSSLEAEGNDKGKGEEEFFHGVGGFCKLT